MRAATERRKDYAMATTTNGGQQGAARPRTRRKRAPSRRRRSTCWRNTPRISRSRIRTRRVRCSPRSSRRSICRSTSIRSRLSDTDFEIELTVEGKADAAGTVLFTFELVYAGIFRLTERAAGRRAGGHDDRMPAPAVSLRARDRLGGGAQWRLPALDDRSGRFRRRSIARRWQQTQQAPPAAELTTDRQR